MKLIVLKNSVPINEVEVETTGINEVYEIYVGRSEDCHVQIDDPLISRHHFVLKNENSTWYCEKLSQLGTVSLNGVIVRKNVIKQGDEIKCGVYSVLITELSGFDEIIETPLSTSVEDVGETMPSEVLDPLPHEDLVESEISELASPESEEIGSLNDFIEIDESLSESDEINTDFGVSDNEFTDALSDDNFGIANIDSDNENTRLLQAFVNYQLVLFGEHAPYDRYQIVDNEIFIGRDAKKCQIILNDPEVSSVHAVIRKNNAEITLEDLNSSNGTILNGERINQSHLANGDEFVIGGTGFTLEIRSDLLESEAERLMPVEADQVIETEEIEDEIVMMDGSGDINFDSDEPLDKSIIKRIWKDPVKRKKAIYTVAGLVFAYVLFGPEESTEPKKISDKPKLETVVDPNAAPKKVLSKELENARNVAYELGVSFFEQSRYDLAEQEFQKVVSIDSEYKKVQSYLEQTRTGLKRLAQLEEQRKAEEDRIKNKKIIDELLIKAREAVKDRSVIVAESYFSQIIEKDPENFEVSQLKLELEAWQKEEERKALERAARETARKRMVDALSPGKTFYLKKEWYRAILKLEEFLRIKGTDEDLVKEASEMLSDAKNQLSSDLGPLLGKARSLKEGQDFKSAYEAFLEILKLEPTNSEALNEVDDIKSQLDSRSKRIYREAIIAESLSLFSDAKEKFQEVQQISPTDSEYYKKASDKLKDYLE